MMNHEPSSMTLSDEERRLLGLWAADCADEVLPLFEAVALSVTRPREAIAGIRAFAHGGKRTARLRALARRLPGTTISPRSQDGARGALDEPGTPGWHIHPKVAPEPGELVLRKTRDDGFDGTELEDVLARKRVTRIAVAGLLSEMCVSATVRGAFARGLHVVLIHGAHATYNLDDIPASVVARVAEHALGDEIEVVDTVSVRFGRPEEA